MKKGTKIQWTMMSGSPFLVCTRVSPGCFKCYAARLAEVYPQASMIRRAYRKAGFAEWETMPTWGDKAPRVLTKGFWKDVGRVQKQAAAQGINVFWFPSLIDWLDTMPAGIIDQDGNKLDPNEVLCRFLKVIFSTPNITWQLLTKRPELFFERMHAVIREQGPAQSKEFFTWLIEWVGGRYPKNVWIGATTENQDMARKRIPELTKIPALCRFLSCEPLLGPIDFEAAAPEGDYYDDAPGGGTAYRAPLPALCGISWVIAGGESGPDSRACHTDWIKDIVRQCNDVGVDAFVKQLGANVLQDCSAHIPAADENGDPADIAAWEYNRHNRPLKLTDQKGGNIDEWPKDPLLCVREIPTFVF